VGVLADQLQMLLPHLSLEAHQIVAAVADKAGVIGNASNLARELGAPNRHYIARLLQREGLPRIEELCGWISVLDLLYHYEQSHASLYQLALRSTRHPPTCYRTIKRIIGKTWVEARSEGFHIALIGFLRRCAELRSRTGPVTVKRVRSTLKFRQLAG
jgi:hypothetical protein